MLAGNLILSLFRRVIIGYTALQAGVIDSTDALLTRLLGHLYPHAGFFDGTLPTVTLGGSPGACTLTLDAGVTLFAAGGALASLSPALDGCVDLPFDEFAATHVGVRVDRYPTAVDVGTDGTMGFKVWEAGVGEVYQPTAVVISGTDLVFTINILPWTDVASSRPVKVWLQTPVTPSSEAIYDGVAELDGAAIKVTVPHFFGQSAPSTFNTDYRVYVPGLVFAGAALDPEQYAHVVGIEPPSAGPDPAFTYTGQRLLSGLDPEMFRSDSWLSSLYIATGVGWKLLRHLEHDGGSVGADGLRYIFSMFDSATIVDPTSAAARQAWIWMRPSDGYTLLRLAGTGLAGVEMGTDAGGLRMARRPATINGAAGDTVDLERMVSGDIIARLAAVGGNQVDDTEAGKKGCVIAGDFILKGTNGKLVARGIPITWGHPTRGFELAVVNPVGPAALSWKVMNLATDGDVWLGIPGVIGQKLVKATITMHVVGVGLKISARLYKSSRTGGIEYQSAEVDWVGGDSEAKDVVATADVEYEAGYHYGIHVYFVNGTTPDITSGVLDAYVTERLFGMQ